MLDRRWRSVAVLALALTAAAARGAAARKPARAPAPARGLGAELVGQLAAELGRPEDEVATAAAKRLGELGGPAAAEALISALSLGLRPNVAADALEALAKIRDARSLPVVVQWASNTNAPVRVSAVKALGRLSDPKVVDVLLERLGDSSPPVRAAAAEALAARKEARAEKRLFLLLGRNDAGAAGPLGAVMSPDAVPRLAELHGRVDDASLASAFGEFLKRNDVPDRLRVDVVRTLAHLEGAAATAALVEYLAGVPERDTRPSKEEAQKAIDQRGGK